MAEPKCQIVVIGGGAAGLELVRRLGARYGRRLTKRWFFAKLLPEDRLLAVQKKFNEMGDKLLFAVPLLMEGSVRINS